MKIRPLPDQNMLAFLLDYNKYTGEVTQYYHLSNSKDNSEYTQLYIPTFFSKSYKGQYRLHRLIWKLCYNTEPQLIDHMNRNKQDNRIRNLREATPKLNANNSGKPSLFKLANGYFIDNHDRYNEIEHNQHGYYFRIKLNRQDPQDHIIKHYPSKYEAYRAYKEFRETHHHAKFLYPNSLEERINIPPRGTILLEQHPFIYKTFFNDTPPKDLHNDTTVWYDILEVLKGMVSKPTPIPKPNPYLIPPTYPTNEISE